MLKLDVAFTFSRRHAEVSHTAEGNGMAWQEGQAFESSPRAKEEIIYWSQGETGLHVCLLETPFSAVQLI